MDELVKLVAAKTGMSEDVARTAVATVLSFLKERLPAPIASQLDTVLNAAGQGGGGDLLSGLGGLFGKK